MPSSPNGLSSKECSSKGVPHAAPRKKNGSTDQVTLIDLNDDHNNAQHHQAVVMNENASTSAHPHASQLKLPMPVDPQYVNCMPPQEDSKDPFDMRKLSNDYLPLKVLLKSNFSF